MSQIVLQKSKILCYFTLDPSIKDIQDELLQPLTLPLTIYHFHYPPVYYPIIYKHFQNSLPPQYTQNHICLRKNGQQLPAELPLGLELEDNDVVSVNVRKSPVPEGFRLTMTSWKKGYTLVNRQAGCDHVFKKINQHQQRHLYSLHVNGHSHGLNKVPKYEGNCIALKIYCEGSIIERKQQNLQLSIRDYFKQKFNNLIDVQKGVLTHGVDIDTDMKLRTLLNDWNYNDGYCYLKVKAT